MAYLPFPRSDFIDTLWLSITLLAYAQHSGTSSIPTHPVGCPHHFAVGDVYELLTILKSIPENQSLRLFNENLAGFFTSIEPERFIGFWYKLLDFLRPKMNVNNDEVL
eukprot:s3088_g2.t1